VNLISERVERARLGTNPYVIARLHSGWLVIGDVQPLPGYCLLLADPVVPSINDLAEADRAAYLLDTARIGDALLAVTDAHRINYETWGNSEPALHTHIMPRYPFEPIEKQRTPACMVYDWKTAPPFDPIAQATFIAAMQQALRPYLRA
jgi:diadenosine tetraphosphate (Ap4A) HIT family hydrolase